MAHTLPLLRAALPSARPAPGLRPAVEAEVAHRLRTATAAPDPAAALATAVFTAASDTQLMTAHRADVAADGNVIVLHDPDGLRFGCLAHPVPVWARPLLRAAAYLGTLANTEDRPLFSDPYQCGGPHLTALSQACRLRPPQPATAPPGRSGRPPSMEPKWPISKAHYRYPWAADEFMYGCPRPPTPTRSTRANPLR